METALTLLLLGGLLAMLIGGPLLAGRCLAQPPRAPRAPRDPLDPPEAA